MYEEAIEHLRRAVQLDPGDGSAQGGLDGAIDQSQRALRLQPGFIDAQRNLAKLRSLADRSRPTP